MVLVLLLGNANINAAFLLMNFKTRFHVELSIPTCPCVRIPLFPLNAHHSPIDGKPLFPVTTFCPVLASNSCRACRAIPPPFFPALAFYSSPAAFMLSAICRVESSARAVKINSASVIWSRKFCVSSPLRSLCCLTLTPDHS